MQYQKMRNFSLLILLLVWSTTFFAQAPAVIKSENIVPNPSFEKYSSTPIGWFYKGKHFTDVMKYWSSATGSSPDVFGSKIRVPAHWAAKGFGQQKPRTGESMVGITVFGCEDGKPHCREYIQIQLREPLVIGQNYSIEFFTSHLPRSMQVNNLGMFFSKKIYDEILDIPIEVTPQFFSEKVIKADQGRWEKVNGEFKADTDAEVLIIGNFFPDSLTITNIASPNSLKYGYYYIDDILVKKEPPFLEVPEANRISTWEPIEEGKIIRLENIFFDIGEAELLPHSYIELQKLLQLLQTYPSMIIEISGHTDIDGNDEYNLQLSTRRAKAVVEYLISEGISPHRTLYNGYGSSRPIAENNTALGKQLNRRVEFLILKK
jgi:OOP family OmpA-OmpF porin